MRIIGLDLSLAAPGYFTCDSHDRGITFGTWQPVGRGLDRMDWICRQVLRLLPFADANGQAEAAVYIEGFSFGSKGSALYEIAGLGYIVRLALRYRGVPTCEVAPSQLKRFATGKGNAPKEIVIREVYRRWEFEAKDNNEADAFVLGQIGLCVLGLSHPKTAEQRAVIAALQAGPKAKAPRKKAA